MANSLPSGDKDAACGVPSTSGPAGSQRVEMVSPLSIGSHVIHVTTQYSFTPNPYLADSTYYLTVQSAPLAIGLSQNRRFALSWPQTPDTNTLESSSDLTSPHWQAVTNLSITLKDGIYCGTGPMAPTNQFFRLRPN